MRDFLIGVWRSALRERSYALINLLGLALGFACCLLLGLFLYSELTYDRHFDKHARIYRLASDITTSGASRQTAWVPRAGAPMLAADYPQIEDYVRFTDTSLQDGLRLRYGDRVFNWRKTFFAGESVFRIFNHQVLAGDPKTALRDPSSVAISHTLARAYFGDGDAIGKILRTDAGELWRVTLVFEDLPGNTHLRYDALFCDKIPLLQDAANQAALRSQLLTGFSAYTYLLMRPGFEPSQWDRMGREFVNRYIAEDARRAGHSLRILMQPLTKLHYSDPVQGEQPTGNRAYLYGCATVAMFILLVACINYTNLATARALRRSRAVGIRKILGAPRTRLLLECLGESVLYAWVAALLGLAMTEAALTLTPIGELLGGMHIDLSANPGLLALVFAAALLIGLVAGAYPAIYFASWMPTAAFSTRGGGAVSGARMREVLVLLQFVMAVGIVAAALVMGAQIRYLATTPLGFEATNRMMVTVRGTGNFARIPALRQELLANPAVLAVAQTNLPPGYMAETGLLNVEDAKGVMQVVPATSVAVDTHYLGTMGLQLVAGDNFRENAAPDTPLIVNETLVRRLGWADPIGRKILYGHVVGVVRDFHVRSLREPIAMLVMSLVNDDPAVVAPARRAFVQRVLIIQVSGRQFQDAVRHVEKVMTRFDPDNPFEYSMLDDSLQELYTTERRMLALIAIFATLCILIACLGLFGLTAFDTERRAREIAIRKVLGASTWQVVMLFARRILVLIVVGGVIAAAVAWLAMDEWLAGFAYRVDASPVLLALAVFLAGVVALATVALQSWRVARADPADALRNE